MEKFKNFWNKKNQYYLTQDWANLPSIFAQWALAYFPKQGKLLELGAGNGQDSRFFIEKGYLVTSTDFARDALTYNRNKVTEEIKGRISIEEADLSEPLPWADHSFDIVYTHLSIHFFDTPTTKQLFDEIFRVLKVKGIFALLVNSTADPDYGRGKKIEDDYFQYSNGNRKRYFSFNSLNLFITKFKKIVLDNQGTSYKDNKIGVTGLVRFVGQKE